MLRLPLTFGRGHLVQLFLAHRLVHALRSALERADVLLAAFRGKRCACSFLLSTRFGRHSRTSIAETRALTIKSRVAALRRRSEKEVKQQDDNERNAHQPQKDTGHFRLLEITSCFERNTCPAGLFRSKRRTSETSLYRIHGRQFGVPCPGSRQQRGAHEPTT